MIIFQSTTLSRCVSSHQTGMIIKNFVLLMKVLVLFLFRRCHVWYSRLLPAMIQKKGKIIYQYGTAQTIINSNVSHLRSKSCDKGQKFSKLSYRHKLGPFLEPNSFLISRTRISQSKLLLLNANINHYVYGNVLRIE